MVNVLTFDGGFVERIGRVLFVKVVGVVSVYSLHRFLCDYDFMMDFNYTALT